MAAGVSGYLFYQEHDRTSGIELNLDNNGASVQTEWARFDP